MRGSVRIALAAPLLSLALLASLSESPRVALADPPPAAVVVALLATPPEGTETELRFVSLDGAADVVVASFSHLPYAVVRGAALPPPVGTPGSSRIVVIADTLPRRDRSWASALVRLEAGQAPVTLAAELARGSRPVLDGQGGVLVERGLAGAEPSGHDAKQRLRVDALAVDRVDVDTGATTTLYSGNGYIAHVAGVLDGEVFLSRVSPPGLGGDDPHGVADLVAVDLATKQLRVVVASWPPMARDFSVDAATHSLVAQQTEESGDRRNVLVRVDAKSGSRAVLASSAYRDLVPFVLPMGGVLFTPEGADRTRVLGAGPEIALPPGGFFWGRATSSDTALALGLVVPERGLPEPVVVLMKDGSTRAVPHSPNVRVELAGFVGGAP